jgi:hypothetical protein
MTSDNAWTGCGMSIASMFFSEHVELPSIDYCAFNTFAFVSHAMDPQTKLANIWTHAVYMEDMYLSDERKREIRRRAWERSAMISLFADLVNLPSSPLLSPPLLGDKR